MATVVVQEVVTTLRQGKRQARWRLEEGHLQVAGLGDLQVQCYRVSDAARCWSRLNALSPAVAPDSYGPEGLRAWA